MLPVASTSSSSPQPTPTELIPPHHRYMCLKEGCQSSFEIWTAVRLHMRDVCHISGKLKLKDSADKCERVRSSLQPLARAGASEVTQSSEGEADPFNGRLKTEPPTELQLVADVRSALDSGILLTQVMSQSIRPLYGQFPFHLFGFGTFSEFCHRNFPEVPFDYPHHHHHQHYRRGYHRR